MQRTSEAIALFDYVIVNFDHDASSQVNARKAYVTLLYQIAAAQYQSGKFDLTIHQSKTWIIDVLFRVAESVGTFQRAIEVAADDDKPKLHNMIAEAYVWINQRLSVMTMNMQ
jgi:hypothetical protein